MREQPDPVAYPDTLIRVRVDPNRVIPDFFSLVWNSPLVRQQVESVARTTAGIYKVNQKHLENVLLPVKHLENVLLPVPSLNEQKETCARTERMGASQARLARALATAAGRAIALRTSLLAAAFSGQLTGRASDMEILEEMAGV